MIDRRSPVSRSDIVFALVLLAFAAVVALILWMQPAGNEVVFRQDGQIVGTYPLNEDRTVEIGGTYLNTFEIHGGSVRVVHTTCPNHQCEKMGAISRVGAALICVPNQVSVSIEGQGGIDAYTG